MRLSPDGSKAALQVAGPTLQTIWTYDFKTGISGRLTFDADAAHTDPVWSPDGTRIAYRKAQPAAGTAHVSAIRADGQGAEEQLMEPGADHYMPNSWSRDGRVLVLEGLGGRFDILRLDVPRTRTQLLAAGAPRQTPRLSPDGQWLAYASAESGRNEIVVQPFPSMDGRWQVSVTGGVAPLWRRDGRGLFYMSDGKLMEVDISTHGGFSAGQPRVLFEGRYRASYDVTPDGERFLMIPMPESAEPPRQFNVTVNWLAALQRRMGAAIGR